MIIVFFSNASNESAKGLLKDIQMKCNGHEIEIVPTMKALSERFHQPFTERTILILMPQNRMQLEELIHMGELINDHPLLLVLPDRDFQTVSIGHKLYPRFVSYLDGDLACLSAVLGKMVENVEHDNGRRQIGCHQ